MQTVTKLLLLSMFAFAARYAPQTASPTIGDTVKRRIETGQEYALDARRLLSKLLSAFPMRNLNSSPMYLDRHIVRGQSTFKLPGSDPSWTARVRDRRDGTRMDVHR